MSTNFSFMSHPLFAPASQQQQVQAPVAAGAAAPQAAAAQPGQQVRFNKLRLGFWRYRMRVKESKELWAWRQFTLQEERLYVSDG